MGDELSFEEFQAIELRSRSKQKAKEAKDAAKASAADDTLEETFQEAGGGGKKKRKGLGPQRGGLLSKLGVFLEMHEMQAAVCILLMLDTFSAFYLSTGVFADDESIFFDIWHRGLKSFSTFALFFFAIEMLANILAFNFSIIGHFGYVVDVLVIAWQVHLESEGASHAYKLMNIFRLWRVLRLFISMLDIEREEHDATKLLVAQAMQELEETKEKLRLVEDDIEREKVLVC